MGWSKAFAAPSAIFQNKLYNLECRKAEPQGGFLSWLPKSRFLCNCISITYCVCCLHYFRCGCNLHCCLPVTSLIETTEFQYCDCSRVPGVLSFSLILLFMLGGPLRPKVTRALKRKVSLYAAFYLCTLDVSLLLSFNVSSVHPSLAFPYNLFVFVTFLPHHFLRLFCLCLNVYVCFCAYISFSLLLKLLFFGLCLYLCLCASSPPPSDSLQLRDYVWCIIQKYLCYFILIQNALITY